jgi:hypothetical protein
MEYAIHHLLIVPSFPRNLDINELAWKQERRCCDNSDSVETETATAVFSSCNLLQQATAWFLLISASVK